MWKKFSHNLAAVCGDISCKDSIISAHFPVLLKTRSTNPQKQIRHKTGMAKAA